MGDRRSHRGSTGNGRAAGCPAGRAGRLLAVSALVVVLGLAPGQRVRPAAARGVPGVAGGVPDFDGEAAQRWVERQVALGPRVPGSAGHSAWLRMVRASLDSLGIPVREERFPHPGPKGEPLQGTNLIASIRPGLRPRLLLGAHWDSRPWCDQDPDPAWHQHPVPGGNDGASGVAVLLELARSLSRIPPPIGIDLAFFDAEDLGTEGDPSRFCLGSRHMAQNWSGTPPDWVVVLDMVGSERTEFTPEAYSVAQSPQLVELLFRLARAKGFSEWNREGACAVFDDHVPFQAMGIPAVDVIGFNDPFWHTHRDDETNTSSRRLRRVGEVLIELIHGKHLVP